LQVLPKSVVDCERNEERGHPGGHSCDRNPSDDSDECLPACRAKVSGSDEKFEAH